MSFSGALRCVCLIVSDGEALRPALPRQGVRATVELTAWSRFGIGVGKRMDRIRLFLWKACHEQDSSRQNEHPWSNVVVRSFEKRSGIGVGVLLWVVVYAPTGPGASFSETPFFRLWTRKCVCVAPHLPLFLHEKFGQRNKKITTSALTALSVIWQLLN